MRGEVDFQYVNINVWHYVLCALVNYYSGFLVNSKIKIIVGCFLPLCSDSLDFT